MLNRFSPLVRLNRPVEAMLIHHAYRAWMRTFLHAPAATESRGQYSVQVTPRVVPFHGRLGRRR
eukprot:5781376-Pyramimonas_sp.AAC.1